MLVVLINNVCTTIQASLCETAASWITSSARSMSLKGNSQSQGFCLCCDRKPPTRSAKLRVILKCLSSERRVKRAEASSSFPANTGTSTGFWTCWEAELDLLMHSPNKLLNTFSSFNSICVRASVCPILVKTEHCPTAVKAVSPLLWQHKSWYGNYLMRDNTKVCCLTKP